MPPRTAVIVIAKEPLPGRAKTRLSPPLSPEAAATVAAAALRDTLAVVARTPCARRVLAFDGDGTEWRPPGFELVAQRGHGLDERLAAAFEDVGGPALLVGMDTPQLTPALLSGALSALRQAGTDAVLGPTLDGGYWAIGLRRAHRRAFEGVPMSVPWTCAAQRARLAALGLRVAGTVVLRDVDTFADAAAVAALAPGTRFAAAVAAQAPGTRFAAAVAA